MAVFFGGLHVLWFQRGNWPKGHHPFGWFPPKTTHILLLMQVQPRLNRSWWVTPGAAAIPGAHLRRPLPALCGAVGRSGGETPWWMDMGWPVLEGILFFWGDHPESARLSFLKVGPSKIGFPQYGALKQRQTGKKTDQFWGGTPRFCRVEYNRGRRF